MSSLSDLACHAHYLAFSWVQVYDILQMLFVIYFVFFQCLLTQGLWNSLRFFKIICFE